MIDWIFDQIKAAPDIDAVHLVTNSVYASAFERWGAERGVVVHDDGTVSNDDRLGALGDIRSLPVERGNLHARRRGPARNCGRQPV